VQICSAVGASVAALALATGVLHTNPVVTFAVVLAAAVVVRALTSSVWAIGLFVLSIPVGLSQSFALGPVDLIHVVGAGTVVLVALHRLLAGRTPLRWHPDAGWAVLLVALAVVATVPAVDLPVALQQTVALTVAVALSLAVNAACSQPTDLRQVLLLLAVVGIGICAYSLRSAGSIEAVANNPGAVDNRAVGIFQSPNELGTFSGLLLFVGLALALGGQTALQRVVGALCAVSSSAALLVSLSRGSWIGALLALTVFLALSAKARRVLLVVFLVGGLSVPLVLAQQAPELWAVLSQRAATVTQPESNPNDARGLIYNEALRQVADRPLTGFGPGDYTFASQSAEATTPVVNALHAHNVVLAVAAEAGIPAAAALVALSLAVAWRVLRVQRLLPARDGDLLIGLSCSLVHVMGQGLVDFPFRNPTLLFLTWAILGFVFAATTSSTVAGAEEARRSRGPDPRSAPQLRPLTPPLQGLRIDDTPDDLVRSSGTRLPVLSERAGRTGTSQRGLDEPPGAGQVEVEQSVCDQQ
jgi:O-antigen ligase